METNISQITAWIQEQTGNINYGEVAIRFVMHAGAIKRIEKTITERKEV